MWKSSPIFCGLFLFRRPVGAPFRGLTGKPVQIRRDPVAVYRCFALRVTAYKREGSKTRDREARRPACQRLHWRPSWVGVGGKQRISLLLLCPCPPAPRGPGVFFWETAERIASGVPAHRRWLRRFSFSPQPQRRQTRRRLRGVYPETRRLSRRYQALFPRVFPPLNTVGLSRSLRG